MGRPQFESPTDIKEQSLSEITAKIQTNVANQLDEDISSHDLIGSGDYATGKQNISGAQEVTIGAKSSEGNVFDVVVEWMDGNGNVLWSETVLSGVTDSYANVIVKSTHVNVKLTDASGAVQNNVDGTINAHG